VIVAMTISMLSAFSEIRASFSEMTSVTAARDCMASFMPERLACPAVASLVVSSAVSLTPCMVLASSWDVAEIWLHETPTWATLPSNPFMASFCRIEADTMWRPFY
jgi:hypothetical protein